MDTGLEGYSEFLADIKGRIQEAQLQAALSVSRDMVRLYWQIGHEILERQEQLGWGAKVVDRLAADLKAAFPGVTGFSRTNLLYMRSFAEAYPDRVIVQQLLDNSPLPWGHHIRLLDRVKDEGQRLWYLRAAHEHGWSRAVLEMQIESGLYRRQGQALTNFSRTLPPPQSDLAQQLLKDPYNFDFLTLDGDAHERQLEKGLLAHLQSFLLEMGAGFSLVGSQYHLEIGGKGYYIDLLFYHLRLRCFVVVDLKMTEFTPEFAGKMNFYLAAVDDLLRHPTDAPSLGLILCKAREQVTVEYALRSTAAPIGVAGFHVTDTLPEELLNILPTVQQLEAEMLLAADARDERES